MIFTYDTLEKLIYVQKQLLTLVFWEYTWGLHWGCTGAVPGSVDQSGHNSWVLNVLSSGEVRALSLLPHDGASWSLRNGSLLACTFIHYCLPIFLIPLASLLIIIYYLDWNLFYIFKWKRCFLFPRNIFTVGVVKFCRNVCFMRQLE